MNMRRGFLVSALAVAVALLAPLAPASARSAYDFSFVSIEGEPLPLERFRGRPILLVNTASFCGFTHQYEGLQTLWERYGERGLVVLGVPSNQFGAQEPGTEAEIKHFCALNYDVTFPMTRKEQVRGADAHPLYRWLIEVGGQGVEPRWNFHKILIAGDGMLAGVWPTRVEPLAPDLVAALEQMLAR